MSTKNSTIKLTPRERKLIEEFRKTAGGVVPELTPAEAPEVENAFVTNVIRDEGRIERQAARNERMVNNNSLGRLPGGRKVWNSALAATFRANGFEPQGDLWEAAKSLLIAWDALGREGKGERVTAAKRARWCNEALSQLS